MTMFDMPAEPVPEPERKPIPPYKRKAKSGGTLPSHTCPGCGAKTKRRIRRFPTLGYTDERCNRCADKLAAWPEQHTDPRRPDATVSESTGGDPTGNDTHVVLHRVVPTLWASTLVAQVGGANALSPTFSTGCGNRGAIDTRLSVVHTLLTRNDPATEEHPNMPTLTLTDDDARRLRALALHSDHLTPNTPHTDRLVKAGYLTPLRRRPDTLTLTRDGALATLAVLAGWNTPADIGDPSVVVLSARCALGTARTQDYDPGMARIAVNGLLMVAGFDPLGPDVEPFVPDPALLAEATAAMADAETHHG